MLLLLPCWWFLVSILICVINLVKENVTMSMLIMGNLVVRWLIPCNRPQEIHVSPLVKSLCSRAENITLLLNIIVEIKVRTFWLNTWSWLRSKLLQKFQQILHCMFVPLKGGKETLLGYVVIYYLFYNRVMFLYVSTSFKRFGEVCEFDLRGLKCINILSKKHYINCIYRLMCTYVCVSPMAGVVHQRILEVWVKTNLVK